MIHRSAFWSGLLLLSSGCGGTEFEEYQAEADPALGVGNPSGPLLSNDRVIGVSFEGLASKGVALYANGTISRGIPSNLAWHTGPRTVSFPPNYRPSDIVSMAMTNDNRTYTWYKNGGRSKGTTVDLDLYFGPDAKSYVVPDAPSGRSRDPSDIVGIAFLPTNNYVYVWYKDGYASVGSTADLGRHVGPGKYWSRQKRYTLPPGKTAADIVDMEMKRSNSHVYTWYKDGTYSIGKSWDLDRYQSPQYYTSHGMLKSSYPTQLPVLGSNPPGPLIVHSIDALDINKEDQNNNVAVGRRHFAVATDSSIQFYNRDGTQFGNSYAYETIFENLIRSRSYGPADRPTDVNHYLNFASDCQSHPATGYHHYCVSNISEGAVVQFDQVGGRFVIYATAKNALSTSQWAHSPFNAPPYDLNTRVRPDGSTETISEATGAYTRRVALLAISRSEDPRDGFFTYAFSQNIHREFVSQPSQRTMSINGDYLSFSQGRARHYGDKDSPIATLVSLKDLRVGRAKPEYLHYYEPDFDPDGHGSIKAVGAVQLPEALTGNSLTVGAFTSGRYRVFAIKHPPARYRFTKPKGNSLPDFIANTQERVFPGRSVFRDGFFHFVGETLSAVHSGEYVYRPFYQRLRGYVDFLGRPVLLPLSSQNRLAQWPRVQNGKEIVRSEPIVQVNGTGDVFIAYGESIINDSGAREHASIHRVLWPAQSALPNPPEVWRLGSPSANDPWPGHHHRIEKINMTVDPRDDRSFWAIHKYRRSNGQWGSFVGNYQP